MNSPTLPRAARDEDLVSFLIERSPYGVLEAVISCALDDDPRGKQLLANGFASTVAHSPKLEQQFFDRLLVSQPLPYASSTIDAYLTGLLPAQLSTFFSAQTVAEKKHPARQALYGAAIPSKNGRVFLDVLAVFMRHGTQAAFLEMFIKRGANDLVRAVAQGNKAFLTLMAPAIQKAPTSLFVSILELAEKSPDVIDLVVNTCAVPVTVFEDPRVLRHASLNLNGLVSAMAARATRQPEREVAGRTPARKADEL